jgi:hypothetical protein
MSRIQFMPVRAKKLDLIYRNPIFKSMGRKPMTDAKQTDLKLAAEVALHSVRASTGNEADRDTLSCVANVCMVLAENHYTAVELAVAQDAQAAILRADARRLAGKGWGFDGPGWAALLALVDVHDQQIEQLGQTAVVEAMQEIMARRARGLVYQAGVAA